MNIQTRKTRNTLHPEKSESVDKERRVVAKVLVTGLAFVAPLMASFSEDGLKLSPATAHAQGKKTKDKRQKPKKK